MLADPNCNSTASFEALNSKVYTHIFIFHGVMFAFYTQLNLKANPHLGKIKILLLQKFRNSTYPPDPGSSPLLFLFARTVREYTHIYAYVRYTLGVKCRLRGARLYSTYRTYRRNEDRKQLSNASFQRTTTAQLVR